METLYFDNPVIWLGITSFVAVFALIYGGICITNYRGSYDKQYKYGIFGSVIVLILVIVFGGMMISRTSATSNMLKKILESDSISNLIDQCKNQVPAYSIEQPVAVEASAKPTAIQSEEHALILKDPYLVLGYDDEKKKLILIQSPNGPLTEKMATDSKSIILAYSYKIGSAEYQQYVNGAKGSEVTLTRYGVILFSYDTETKEVMYVRKLTGSELPNNGKGYNGKVSVGSIIDAVNALKSN